jgi:uncharacterized protein
MLREKINDAVKEAMKAKDAARLGTLRMVNSAIKNADIEARTGKGPLTDDDLLAVMQKMVKQRQESLDIYTKSGRDDMAAQERAEIETIQGFMPQQLSDDELKAAVAAAIAETGAASVKDMGKVIGVLKAKYTGRMDFGKASGAVKAALAG